MACSLSDGGTDPSARAFWRTSGKECQSTRITLLSDVQFIKLTASTASEVASDLNSNITMWMIPSLWLLDGKPEPDQTRIRLMEQTITKAMIIDLGKLWEVPQGTNIARLNLNPTRQVQMKFSTKPYVKSNATVL